MVSAGSGPQDRGMDPWAISRPGRPPWGRPGVVVILDGASEPVRSGVPTSLERAETPTLDALAARGTLTRVKTIADGLVPGSEVAIPALLGAAPGGAVDRGDIEAAAHDIEVPEGARAWRVDVRCSVGGRASAVATARAAEAIRVGAPGHAVHALGGHRLLVVGPVPLPAVAQARGLRAWPEGRMLPSGVLGARDVVVAARGACAGVARRLGASVLHPAGVTGDVDTDLGAKAVAARAALAGGAPLVVVHVAGADEAAHRGDADGKVAFLERVDRALLAPLADAVRAAGATLRVLPDHGCDPRTGAHDAEPVPCLSWPAADSAALVGAPGAPRLTERAVAALPVLDLASRTREGAFV